MSLDVSLKHFNSQNSAQKDAYKSNVQVSEAFSKTLNSVVGQELAIAVKANEEINKSNYRKNKDLIEKGQALEKPETEDESIYKTVKQIENRLIKLARLERKMLAGF